MTPQPPARALIFDLGDVLFKWSSTTTTSIPSKTIRQIVNSPTWFEYECARITQSTCYELIAKEFRLEASEVAEAFNQARDSLDADPAMVRFIEDLRANSSVKVFAMSNIALEDFDYLSDSEKMNSTLFERVFTSGAAGMRKPDPDFYRFVLKEIQIPAEQVVFVDDKEENIRAAKDLGIRGIIFDDSTMDTLNNIFQGPSARAYEFLYQNARQFDSMTDIGVAISDNFAELLILEKTKHLDLVNVKPNQKGTWNYFAGEATLVPGGYFPDDLDTTALGLMNLPPSQSKVVHRVLDRMVQFANPDGSFLTYFDRSKPRIDAVVSANVLACFYHYGRGHEHPRTLQYIHDVLQNRTYENGTRYYLTPDCCLYFFSRLWQYSKNDPQAQLMLGPLLKARLRERVGKSGSPLDLAMRVLACASLGIHSEQDRDSLARLQCHDGSWEIGWMYRYGSTGMRIGNQGVTTAFALNALSTGVSTSVL